MDALSESIIKQNRLAKSPTLELKKQGLRKIPSEIFELEHLTSIDLSGNQLEELPDAISRLPRLTSLRLSNNSLWKISSEIRKLKYLKELHLGSNELWNIPEEISKLQTLEDLRIDNNNLISIPNWISELVRLRILRLGRRRDNRYQAIANESLEWVSQMQGLIDLDLSNLYLKRIPEWLIDLTNLIRLSLYGNLIASVPRSFSKLVQLEYLRLGHNKLRTFPPAVLQLQKLSSLSLDDNRQIKAVPDEIAKLTELTHLSLYRTEISNLPESFENLTKLRTLLLWNCRFKCLPPALYRLPALEHLSFRNNSTTSRTRNNNHINEISPKILDLKNLKELDLAQNPIVSPPPEIVARGVSAIRQYFIDLGEGEDYLFEAKLLIVGEPGAGKTTLAKKIKNSNYVLPQNEESTDGIDVTQWFFNDNGNQVRVNIWDFGGQEIYHATHQFFLTKRSLYALVADTRRDDTDFHYWLNVAELLSHSSPLLIVKNERQDRHREINERSLRAQFTNLQKVLDTNFASNRGLQPVVAELKHHITNLPHIGTPLPRRWVRIRQALESEARNYITIGEFLNICEKNGFHDLQRKLVLSDYLHDLGVCLHFQNDPLLKRIVILKPNWGTDAVYKVLDNREVIKNLGRFTKQDLNKIWADKEFENMHDELLQLMINFKLCYKIIGENSYIAPQLLSDNQMYYDWNEADNLHLRFTYDFMPKGILTQLIVVMHEFILRQKYVWKSGVILEKENTRAEVIEYYSKREIRIRVSGDHKKDLLTIVIHELDRIHKTFERLQYRKLIPCNCDVCAKQEEAHYYDFKTLRKFASDRQRTIQCPESYKMVNVRSLIDEVIDKNRTARQREDDIVLNNSVGDISAERYDSIVGERKAGYAPRGQIMSNKNNPWVSGGFYVVVFVVTVAALLGALWGTARIGAAAAWITLPVILITALLAMIVIGAMQLKNDERYNDKHFSKLMVEIVRRAVSLGRRDGPK